MLYVEDNNKTYLLWVPGSFDFHFLCHELSLQCLLNPRRANESLHIAGIEKLLGWPRCVVQLQEPRKNCNLYNCKKKGKHFTLLLSDHWFQRKLMSILEYFWSFCEHGSYRTCNPISRTNFRPQVPSSLHMIFCFHEPTLTNLSSNQPII